jgi:hypothetical protein
MKDAIYILLMIPAVYVAFAFGQHDVRGHTKVVEHDFREGAVFSPYFGTCYDVDHKEYCATDGWKK